MQPTADAGSPADSSPAPRQRRLVYAIGVLVAVAAALVAVVLGTRSSPPAATANTSRVAGSATVQRRDLVETDTESGTLGYADPQTVYNRLSGTITWLPSVGQVIVPGHPLYRVNGSPVVLFDGALPAYRTLKAGDGDGLDILQLNRDLVQMGFADGQITIDGTWQTATTDAVERWQASLDEKQTGKIALGRIVFLPGAQRVTQLTTNCGSTGGGSGSGSGSGNGSAPTNGCGISEASTAAPASHPEFVDFTTSSTRTAATTSSTTTTTTTTTTRSSGHKPGGGGSGHGSAGGGGKSSGSGNGSGSGHGSGNGNSAGGSSGSGSGKSSSGSSSGSGKGSGGSSGSGSRGSSGNGTASAPAILQTTSTQLVVTVDLDASKQSEAQVGEAVTVEMPSGSTVTGRITAVSSVAQSSSGSGSSGSAAGSGAGNGSSNGSGSSGSTVPVTITLSNRQPGAGLDQASVSVNFSQAKANNVLSVPVTALLATPGGYAVQVAAAPHKLIPVTTGLFAAGYVQVSGPGIHPGLEVTDSQG